MVLDIEVSRATRRVERRDWWRFDPRGVWNNVRAMRMVRAYKSRTQNRVEVLWRTGVENVQVYCLRGGFLCHGGFRSHGGSVAVVDTDGGGELPYLTFLPYLGGPTDGGGEPAAGEEGIAVGGGDGCGRRGWLEGGVAWGGYAWGGYAWGGYAWGGYAWGGLSRARCNSHPRRNFHPRRNSHPRRCARVHALPRSRPLQLT